MTPSHPLYDAMISGDAEAARCVTVRTLAEGVAPLSLVNDYMIPAMEDAGKRFAAGEYFVPDLLIRARAMKTAMAILRPLLVAAQIKSAGRVVLGTVNGDVHDIGKNLVGAMLEGCGFEVVDLGVNVSPEKFIAAINERNPHIVGMSALLTSTMYSMKTTIDAMVQAGVRDKVKVLIGGAPVTRQFAQEIGADGSSNNAVGAVAVAKMAMGLQIESTAGVYWRTA
ncbi:MAG: corrinoid protein [Verrucomicrobia bacterium]|nr:corrinoid protein [Verrucomicrobiota bacterium]